MKNLVICVLLTFIISCSSEPQLPPIPMDKILAKVSKEIKEEQESFKGHRLFIWKAPFNDPKTYLLINDSNVINEFDTIIRKGFSQGYYWGAEEQYYMHLCVKNQQTKGFTVHMNVLKDTVIIMSNTRNWGFTIPKNEWEALLSKSEKIRAKELKDSCNYYTWYN